MKLYIALVCAFALMGGCSGHSPTNEAWTKNEQALDASFPSIQFPWNTQDAEVVGDELRFHQIRTRLQIEDSASKVAECDYYYRGSEDTVFLKTRDGNTWRILSVDGTYSSRKQRFTHVTSFKVASNFHNESAALTLSTNTENRWVNVTQVICPNDGELYEDTWMSYRFPSIHNKS